LNFVVGSDMSLLIFVALFLIILFSVANTQATTKTKKFCKLHKWKQKPLDPDDPEGPIYLVCEECKYVFGSDDGFEESER